MMEITKDIKIIYINEVKYDMDNEHDRRKANQIISELNKKEIPVELTEIIRIKDTDE